MREDYSLFGCEPSRACRFLVGPMNEGRTFCSTFEVEVDRGGRGGFISAPKKKKKKKKKKGREGKGRVS